MENEIEINGKTYVLKEKIMGTKVLEALKIAESIIGKYEHIKPTIEEHDGRYLILNLPSANNEWTDIVFKVATEVIEKCGGFVDWSLTLELKKLTIKIV